MSDKSSLNQTLSMAQSHMLLTESGAIGSLSPVEKLGDAPDQSERQAMIEKGLMDTQGTVLPKWQTVAHVLADPESALQVAVAGRGGMRILRGYLNPSLSESLAGFTPVSEDRYHLSWPLRSDHILAMLVSGLGLDEDVPAQELTETLSVDALVALSGYADAVRSMELGNMLERITDKVRGSDFEQIFSTINKGLNGDDRRWSVTLLRDLLPATTDRNAEQIHDGLNELTTLGWLQEEQKEYWTMTEAGRIIFTHWQMPMASAMFHVTVKSSAETQTEPPLGMLRTIASLWIVQQKPASQEERPMMQLTMVSSPDLLDLLQRKIDKQWIAEEAAPAAVTAGLCNKCGASTVPGAKFCSKCGGKVLE